MDKTGDVSLASEKAHGSGIARRQLLRLSMVGAAVAGATVWAGCARAQKPPEIEKASKKVAGYIEKTQASNQDCSQCHFYISPDTCMIVEGLVAPWGYCNYFSD